MGMRRTTRRNRQTKTGGSVPSRRKTRSGEDLASKLSNCTGLHPKFNCFGSLLFRDDETGRSYAIDLYLSKDSLTSLEESGDAIVTGVRELLPIGEVTIY